MFYPGLIIEISRDLLAMLQIVKVWNYFIQVCLRKSRINAIPSNCIVTKLDRQQMQGNDVMCLLYFDINLYHLRTKAGYK